MADKHMGKLTYIRIYSGTVPSGTVVYNSSRDREQRIGRLLRMHANRQEPVAEGRCGDILGVVVAVAFVAVHVGVGEGDAGKVFYFAQRFDVLGLGQAVF